MVAQAAGGGETGNLYAQQYQIGQRTEGGTPDLRILWSRRQLAGR